METHKPKEDEGKAPAEQTESKQQTKPPAPPAIITVDTKGPSAAGKGSSSGNGGGGDASQDEAASSKASSDLASQAQTPKHANTVKDISSSATSSKKTSLFKGPPPPPLAQSKEQHRHAGGSSGGGAFQPRDRSGYPPVHPGEPPLGMQQVSPTGGGARFYPAFSNPPPGRYSGHYDMPRFSQGPGYQQADPYHHRGHGPPMFPMRGYPPGPEYHGRQQQHHWAGPPSFAAPGRGGHAMMPNSHTNTVSRAVSSSFDRSIKSRDDSNSGKVPTTTSAHPGAPAGDDDDHASVGDASWKMLKQVHSVDEEEMRKRTSKVALDHHHRPASNSSSLTNSPTDEIEGKKVSTKHGSSLDSLSSVASAQEPMDTTNKSKALSPSNQSTGSLDLMKCPSGSSALLLPAHQRNLSQFSLPSASGGGAKRPHEEARGDSETSGKDDSAEVRRHPSSDVQPPTKKGRVQTKDAKKGSPLSITCSPPNSPTHEKTKAAAAAERSKVHQPKPVYAKNDDNSPGFYDQPPSYSYSLDSAVPREAGLKQSSTHVRPGSSASSTATPMQVEGNGAPPSVGQLPSWEIHPQDSFGGASVNAGNGLMSSFSFVQEYPMLPASGSGEHGGRPREAALESRNPSFDAGHGYAGNIGRSDSMMSYDRHGPYDGRTGYPGQFPPAAPSWGSAGSYATAPAPATGPPPVYGMIRNSTFPSMVRNYSEDSGVRTSPPPGSSGARAALPPSFQPPPEFRAPPSMMSKGSQQNTIITSPYNPTPKTGPFGWTKEEDNRLTEIMKKFKNPRDWEPIAKEHNRGRTAKECHERWIRYLKPGVRKGQWTDHEDAIVMEVVSSSSEQPFTRWSDLAQRLPGRVGKQIRDRWVNHLNPAINHLPFSREDDMKLWNGHKQLGKRWVEIATKCFNSTRSENHIKNRWYSASFKKFITNEFGLEAYLGTVKNKAGKKNNGKALPDNKKHRKPGTPGSSPRRRMDPKLDPSQVEAV